MFKFNPRVSLVLFADSEWPGLSRAPASPAASRYHSPRHKPAAAVATAETTLSVAHSPRPVQSRRQEGRSTTPSLTLSSSPRAPPSPLDLARMAAINASVGPMPPPTPTRSTPNAATVTARPRMWQCNSLPTLARSTSLTGRELVIAASSHASNTLYMPSRHPTFPCKHRFEHQSQERHQKAFARRCARSLFWAVCFTRHPSLQHPPCTITPCVACGLCTPCGRVMQMYFTEAERVVLVSCFDTNPVDSVDATTTDWAGGTGTVKKKGPRPSLLLLSVPPRPSLFFRTSRWHCLSTTSSACTGRPSPPHLTSLLLCISLPPSTRLSSLLSSNSFPSEAGSCRVRRQRA